MIELDVEFVRSQFPALSDPRSAGWAHLENAGGSYVPQQVSGLLTDFFAVAKVQPYWDFAPSVRAGEAMDRAHDLVPATLNAGHDEVILGPSTSMNTYVLSHALRAGMVEGDEVIVTDQDHEANIGAWRRLESTGIAIREWQVDPVTGLLDIADLAALLSERTRLVAVTHASNIAATVNPIRAIADLVHAAGGLLVVDGVSYAPHTSVDVRALDCDVYLYSAYKTFGPHVGVMYVRAALLESVANQGHFFNADKPRYLLNPAGPNHAEVAAMAGVIDYYVAVYEHHVGSAVGVPTVELVRVVFDLFAAREQKLMAPLGDFLTTREGVRLIGTASTNHTDREPTFGFASNKVPSADIYRALIDAQVSCGHGNFYAYRLIQAVGLDPVDGVVRLSLVHYNTESEVSRALTVLAATL